jgi:hypothetical protein
MVQVDEIEVKREESTGGNHLDVLWPIGLCGVGGQSGDHRLAGLSSSFRKPPLSLSLCHILGLFTFIAFYETIYHGLKRNKGTAVLSGALPRFAAISLY